MEVMHGAFMRPMNSRCAAETGSVTKASSETGSPPARVVRWGKCVIPDGGVNSVISEDR